MDRLVLAVHRGWRAASMFRNGGEGCQRLTLLGHSGQGSEGWPKRSFSIVRSSGMGLDSADMTFGLERVRHG